MSTVDLQPPPLPTRDEAIAALTAPGQRYELQRLDRGDHMIRVFANAPASLRTLYAETRSERPFIVYEDERWSFDAAYQDSARIAALLARRHGVSKGDRVAISARNYPEWMLAFAAATSLGAIVVAMNAHWRPDEMEYGLLDSGAKVLIADQERLDRLAAAETAPAIDLIAIRPGPGEAAPDLMLLAAQMGEAAMPPAQIEHDDAAAIFYTSGSTGHPKGVICTHRGIISALLSWELEAQISARLAGLSAPAAVANPATLLTVPLFHATGAHAVFLHSYRQQRKTVAMYKWDAEQAAALIERERITVVTAPSAITGDLVRVARQTGRDLSSLITVGGGGAARAPEQVRQIDAVFDKVLPTSAWGMTETNAIGTSIGGPAYLQRPGSAGRVSAVMDIKVIDEDGRELPAGERGELMVRGAAMLPGYWNRPQVNAALFEPGGWFHTGDIAYIDADGFLFIVDRLKDLIIRGGENIGCGQVEAALLAHPKVREAAVYAVPDERLGEEVGATLYAEPGLDLDELRDFLSAHLAGFEIPRYFRLSAEPLPRTASEKIFKRGLREQAVAALKAEAAA